jgi:hypothetical protein
MMKVYLVMVHIPGETAWVYSVHATAEGARAKITELNVKFAEERSNNWADFMSEKVLD